MDDLNPTLRKKYALTRAAAAIYRTLGALVEEDVSLAGCQLDLLVTLPESSGKVIRCAIDCKPYSKLVGLHTVNSFNAVTRFLRQRNFIDRAVLVSLKGFTKNALTFGAKHQLELIKLSELQIRLRGKELEIFEQVDRGFEEEARIISTRPRVVRVFVVMPFAKKFDDVYVIGIREVAERLGLVVERGDDLEHNSEILEVIQQSLRDSELVIADLTSSNPNVFYEVGYAHAAGTPTILLSDGSQKSPFDVQSLNQVFYESLVDLREKLERRIRATLGIK